MQKKVIFGAGIRGNNAFETAKRLGISIDYFCDNNSEIWGTVINSIPVISPLDLSGLPLDTIIIVASKFAEAEIKEQLKTMGFTIILNTETIAFWNRLSYLHTDRDNEIISEENNNETPYISIVIKMVRPDNGILSNCIDNIKKSNLEHPYEIVIWDQHAPIISGEIVVILYSNSMVQDNWLNYLLQSYNKYESNCIIGSKTIDINGKIRQAGYLLWKSMDYEAYGEGCFFAEPEYEYVREADALSANGMLFSRELWKDYEKSFEEWGNDTICSLDFCLTQRMNEKAIVFQPLSLIIEMDNDQLTQVKLLSADDKFNTKWKRFFDENQFGKCDGYKLEVINRKKFIFKMFLADSTIAAYDTNAGNRATYNYIRLFLELGAQIVYLADNMQYSDKYTPFYQQMGIYVVYGRNWAGNYSELLKKYLGEFDYAFLNRPDVANKYLGLLHLNPGIVIAHFGHDLHYLRFQREFELTGNSDHLAEAEKYKDLEFWLINQVDFTGYPSWVEVNLLKKELPEKNIQYFPLSFYDEYELQPRKYDANGIMFVGGFWHRPNVDAACFLVNEITPLLREKGVMDKIYIVGSNPSQEVLNLKREDVIVTGYVDDLSLAELYRNCKIAIAPLQYGAGMKGKVLEAMYQGIPLVTTDIGAEGLLDIAGIISIGNTAQEIADQVVSIYEKYDSVQQYSEREYHYIIDHFGKEQMKQLILGHLNSKSEASGVS